MDVLKWLNDNGGALTAVSTLAYIVLTSALLLEARASRNSRRDALVDARLHAHPEASMYLELEVRNLGPAVARDVVIEYWFTDAAGAVAGERRRQGELSLTVGDRRRFLPGTPGLDFLSALGESGYTIHVRWEWTDDRRRWVGRPLRHRRSLDVTASRLATDFFGGWALTESELATDVHTIADELKLIGRHTKELGDAAAEQRRERLAIASSRRRAASASSARGSNAGSNAGELTRSDPAKRSAGRP